VNISFDFVADKNLVSLEFQLQNKIMKKICEVMIMNQSSYISQFLTLAEEIEVSTRCRFIDRFYVNRHKTNKKQTPWPSVRKRTIPKFSANLCGQRGVTWSAQRIQHGR
jgi:hypothetical protein